MYKITDVLVDVAIIAGATVAAVHFENPTLLWWYILALFV